MSNRAAAPTKPATGLHKLVRWSWRAIGRHWLVLSVFLLVAAIFGGPHPGTFFTGRNLLNIVRTFSWIAVAAFGESLVIMIGGIDLSVGAVAELAGLVSALSMRAGLPVPVAIAAGLLIGGLVGWTNGMIVGHVRLPPFIVSLATMSIARGTTHGLSGGRSVTVLPEAFRMLGQGNLSIGPVLVPLPALFMLGLAVLIGLLIKLTPLGQYIYTLADNEQALRASGVKPAQVKTLVYTLCGALAATGGLLMTARLGVAAPSAAVSYELDIIATAVIGGTSLFGGEGSIPGVLLGAAVMQMLRNGLVLLRFSAYWQTAALGTMILIFVLLDCWRRRR